MANSTQAGMPDRLKKVRYYSMLLWFICRPIVSHAWKQHSLYYSSKNFTSLHTSYIHT